MTKLRLPILPTILVVAAAAVMAALGVWQLGRAEEKAALLARFERAAAMSSEIPFPIEEAEVDSALYRHSSLTCTNVIEQRVTAARNALGQTGLAQIARCELPGGAEAEVAFGWTSRPRIVPWNGGEVSGFVAPAGDGARLVASPPLAGLDPLAAPDPNDLPNNHLAYAFQWFFFALTALVIYALALRRREKP